jgi:DNA-directed RNA polymerase subunit E'/Rpb7
METVEQPTFQETQTQIQTQTQTQKPQTSTKVFKKKEIKHSSIYTRSVITQSVVLPIVTIGKNIKETLEKAIVIHFEGKCIVEGYVKTGSCKIITHSSGLIQGVHVKFEVVFECFICSPVEGMLIPCVARNITKAGIRAESDEESPSPIVVFIMRDHNYMNKYFTSIKENDKFIARVIGQRFELNDKYVSIIGEAVEPKKDYTKSTYKPKLVIED